MYDARGGGSSSNGTMFGLAVGGVIVAAFAAVFFWPTGNAGSNTNVIANGVQVHAAFESEEEQAFAKTLRKVDEASYLRLEKRFQNGGVAASKRHEIMMEEILTVAMDHIGDLARSDVKYFTAMIDDVNNGLKSASRSGEKLCKGSTYTSLQNMNEVQVGRFLEREILSKKEIREFALKLNRRMLEAILEARKNPKNYGPMQASDQRAVQNMARKLMFQPEFLGIAMSMNSGRNPEAALAKIDVCELGHVVLRTINQLPEQTKGRIWAQAIAEVEKNGSFDLDPSGMSALSGF